MLLFHTHQKELRYLLVGMIYFHMPDIIYLQIKNTVVGFSSSFPLLFSRIPLISNIQDSQAFLHVLLVEFAKTVA